MDISVDAAAAKAAELVENISSVLIGKTATARLAVTTMLAGGHILLEDVPGVGKTLLAKALSKSISGELRRVQFTADLLPSDITGVTVFDQRSGGFNFRPGPVFANIMLGDEINRATPRTQSSLLEAMEELQVTVDGVIHELPRPFFVIATQNPIELEGTYPLPFSQMDRFMARLRIGYLDAEHERDMLRSRGGAGPLEKLEPALDLDTLAAIQVLAAKVKVSDELYDYLVAIVQRSRDTEEIEYGVSPRGALDLLRHSQSNALVDGRDYLLPDDIKSSAPLVLGHRVIVRRGAQLASAASDDAVRSLLHSVPVPV